MSSSSIIDNWSLQHVGELLTHGASHGNASVVRVSGDNHFYEDISEAVIQTEALFDLLTQIVLRDEIFVDSDFTDTWDSNDNPLRLLSRARLLRPVRFLDREEHFAALRQHIVKRLCVTPSLRHAHEDNVASWSIHRAASNPFLSAVLWGGAGMVARSSYFGASYAPHPLRRRLFVEAKLLLDGSSAFAQLDNVIREKRLIIAKGVSPIDPLYALHVSLPPIPIHVINESKSPNEYIEVALRLRDEYRQVREWLRAAETAIIAHDAKGIRKLQDDLSMLGASSYPALAEERRHTSLSVNIGFLSFSIPVGSAAAIRNLFGARAVMNRMILKETGRAALARYTQQLGEPGSIIEHQLREHFGKNA